MKQIRKRLTYANVMSSIAVFLILGGASAFAATQLGKNTVGSKQLKKNAVTAAKIKNNAVTAAKIQNGAVSGAKINLSTLGKVPSASTADTATAAGSANTAGNANTVGGRSVTKIFVKIPVNSTVTIGTFGPFKIAGTCDAAGGVEDLEIDPQTLDTDLAAQGYGSAGAIFTRNQGSEDNSISLNESGGINNVRGISTFSGSQSGGFVMTGTLAYNDTSTFDGENVCAVYGQVIS